ncbi:O-antigen ligase family protein [Candidatus Pelagibacter sp.]|uniref:O-antigen ligase family protein n=1 Tax=Candidatus Pelagibacter sp. TaxID=2024849 RepID=UPI003F878A00
MNKFQNGLDNFSFILFLLIPLSLISGPFIPDLFLVIIVLHFIIITYLKKNYNLLKNKVFLFLIIFCSYTSLVSLFSLNINSIQSGSLYFRFALFALASSLLIEKKIKYLIYLLYLILIIYIVLIVDSLHQFKFNENIIGLKIIEKTNFRITSFFGKDEILGSYSVRLLPLTLFLVIFYFNNSKNIKIILFTILIIAISIIVLLSGERTSFALFILMIIFLFSSSFKLRKLLLIPTVIAMITFVFVVLKSDTIKNRMVDTTINQLGLNKKSERLVLFSEIYEGHYLVALNMFKEKPVFGHGAKMFRYYCAEEENFVAPNACTTHPHNFYAQLLAETGIIGFMLIFIIYIYILYLYIKNFYYQIIYKKQLITDLGLCLLASFFITLFPILPSGNLFNNWLSIIIYYPLGFLLYVIKNKKFYV